MKKVLIALTALIWSTTANAGAYSDAVNIQKTCNAVAVFGERAFKGRLAWQDPSNAWDNLSQEIRSWTQVNDRAKQAYRYAIDYGSFTAKSEKDAHMTSWAYCMDLAN